MKTKVRTVRTCSQKEGRPREHERGGGKEEEQEGREAAEGRSHLPPEVWLRPTKSEGEALKEDVNVKQKLRTKPKIEQK